MPSTSQIAQFAAAAAVIVLIVCVVLVLFADGDVTAPTALSLLPTAAASALGCIVLVLAATKLTLRCFRGGGFDLYWPWLLLALVGSLMLSPNWGASLGLSAIVLVFVARRQW